MNESSTRTRRPFVILNPAAGRGRRSRRVDRYLGLLRSRLGDFEYRRTTHPGEERDLVDEALEAGADHIIAAGGDGTWSNVADRLVSTGFSDVTLGVLPSGTGNDFAKGLGISYDDPEAAVDAVAGHCFANVDVGRGTFRGPRGSRTRFFLLVAGVGLDTAVLHDVERARFLPGDIVYALAALRQLFRFKAVSLEMRTGDGMVARGDHLILALCNGSSIGGSFHVAPTASLSDGRLDACVVRDGNLRERMSVLRRALKGTHGDSPLVDLFKFEELSIRLDQPTRYQIDGEIQSDLIHEAEIGVVRGALRVAAPRVGSSSGSED